MKTRKLRQIEVSEIGMGCMGFSHGYCNAPYGHRRHVKQNRIPRSHFVNRIGKGQRLPIGEVIMKRNIKNMVLTAMFLAEAFLKAIPGILIQLILIPSVMVALNRTGLVRFHRVEP